MSASSTDRAADFWLFPSQPASSSCVLCLLITVNALRQNKITSTHLSSHFCLKTQLEKKKHKKFVKLREWKSCHLVKDTLAMHGRPDKAEKTTEKHSLNNRRWWQNYDQKKKDKLTPILTFTFPLHKTIWKEKRGFQRWYPLHPQST